MGMVHKLSPRELAARQWGNVGRSWEGVYKARDELAALTAMFVVMEEEGLARQHALAYDALDKRATRINRARLERLTRN